MSSKPSNCFTITTISHDADNDNNGDGDDDDADDDDDKVHDHSINLEQNVRQLCLGRGGGVLFHMSQWLKGVRINMSSSGNTGNVDAMTINAVA